MADRYNVSDRGTFHYQQLPAAHYIRVLIVYPSQQVRSPVFAEMTAMPLCRSSEYAALSYSWGTNSDGDASTNRLITIGNARFPVTQNLFEALQTLRSTSTPQPVWVDAICINQKDVAERNSQVTRMAKIYEYASQVVAWLGDGTSDEADRSALALLSCLDCPPRHRQNSRHQHNCGLVTALWTFDRALQKCEKRLSSVGRDAHALRVSGGLDALPSSTVFHTLMTNLCHTLGALLGRRYFQRRWIVQELYHPAHDRILFAWGSCTYPVKQLINSLDNLQAFLAVARRAWLTLNFLSPMQDDEQYRELTRLEGLACDIYNMLQMKSPDRSGLSLHKALQRCSKFRCSDARDIVFALVSLDPAFGLVPDYSLSIGEVYISFAKTMAERGLAALLFRNLRDQRNYGDQIQLPTWVPDLRNGFVGGGERDPLLQGYVARQSNVLGVELFVIGTIDKDPERIAEPDHYHDSYYLEYDGYVESDATHSRRLGLAHVNFRLFKTGNGRRLRRLSLLREALDVYVTGDGTPSADTAAALRQGDMICAIQPDWWVLKDQFSGEDQDRINDMVLLRPSENHRGIYNVARVFPSEDLQLLHESRFEGKNLGNFSTRTTIYIG